MCHTKVLHSTRLFHAIPHSHHHISSFASDSRNIGPTIAEINLTLIWADNFGVTLTLITPKTMDILRQYVDIELALRFVSYAIVVGAAVVKLPQIINILRVGSARGLSLPALYLETVATLAGTIYNVLIGNPFRTYGETALILVQNLFIVLLVWNKSPVKISASEKLVATSVLVGVGAALWNVRALEPDWPAQLKNLGISPLDMVYNFMTALFIVARVRGG